MTLTGSGVSVCNSVCWPSLPTNQEDSYGKETRYGAAGRCDVGRKRKEMTEAKKRERVEALKKVKEPRKEFGFPAGMLRGALAEERGKK